MLLNLGDTAPDFSLLDAQGDRISLTDLRGKWIVLYFYPRDNTPGCTKEACSFKDNYSALQAQGQLCKLKGWLC